MVLGMRVWLPGVLCVAAGHTVQAPSLADALRQGRLYEADCALQGADEAPVNGGEQAGKTAEEAASSGGVDAPAQCERAPAPPHPQLLRRDLGAA
jgi:hypothetical protein